MGPRVALDLCGGEVQCREATQEFRASLEVKAGTVPAEIHRQRRQMVRAVGMIHQIEHDWKCHAHSNRFAQVVLFPFAWYLGGCGSRLNLRVCCKQDLKAEWQGLIPCSLDQGCQDNRLFTLGHIKGDDEMGDWRPRREPGRPALGLTV